MGTGKTAVGRLLAEKLGREFIEIDAIIEKRAGKTSRLFFVLRILKSSVRGDLIYS